MKRIFAVFLAVFLVPFAPVTAFAEDDVEAAAYVLIEAESGIAVLEKNADKQLNIGYLSKLMTVLLIGSDIAAERYSMSTVLTASDSVTGTKGAVIWLESGDKMTVEELLKAVIIGNANDAVTVLAENSQGTVEGFVSAMNSRAFDLGLRNTAFFSPYGYYDEREHSTAREVAVICRELAKFGFLEPIFKTWRDFVKEGKTELVSENSLTRTYDRHIGFKMCHRDDLYSIAEGGRREDGTCYIAVVLEAPDGDNAMKTAKMLIKRGFSDYKATATMFPDEMLMPLKVRGGRDMAVEIRLAGQSRLVIPKSVKELSTVTVIPEYINAPVKKGQPIGLAGFYSGKELVCETEIIAADSVDVLTLGYVVKKMLTELLN